jgi:hypothetical protein
MRRRALLALGVGAALTGCGFHPVYMPTASGQAGVAESELAAIHVNLMSGRPGQLMRQALQERLEGAGSSVAKRYDLTVGFGVSGEGIGILESDTATRVRLVGTATWTLTSQDPGHAKLDSGFAKSVDGFNLIDSQYFTADMENEAVQKRMAEALADQIAMQLATFFRKRVGGLNG